ncbi:hypothetical protein [Variovorax boronicumulans]|uniref:hypothetical protein n=1 Tax=Variovorax boronicumulans TaxID=436515 RepID=UPI001C56FD35
MPIKKGDVKLVKSRVMDDVPEGGDGPTANPVEDGKSNAIFPDISETDRAAGRVSARKLHVWVQSPDTDTYLGANVIVAEPPNDPNVSVTLFSTGDTFDTRTAAISRVEAYLSIGASYPGFLSGNHIKGQATLSIFQRTAELPPIGGTLALTWHEALNDKFVQYVRVTEATATLRTFTDTGGEFQRYILELKLSDPLRADFTGYNVSRIDPTVAEMERSTKINGAITTDAAKYAGVVPTSQAAQIGDFSVKASSIFTQLVPSAQIETPIADARSNQLLAGVVGGGAAVSVTVTMPFTTTQSLFIGGAVKPNTLSLSNGGTVLTDVGGRLMSAGTQVGVIDYENGVLSLLTNAFGTGALTFALTYQPAQVPEAVTQSQGFLVTAENRSLSYVRTIEPPPEAGTLFVAYMVARRWYVIRDDGSGAIRGPDTGFGSGQLNPSTGTVAVTLGALPDVGSELIYQWVEPKAARDASQLTLDNDGRLYWQFNTSGQSSLEPGDKPIVPTRLEIKWVEADGTTERTVTDDGHGRLMGYGTGTVGYAKGVIRLSPTTLPPRGTQVSVILGATTNVVQFAGVPAVGASGSVTGNLGASDLAPGSVGFTMRGLLRFRYKGGPVRPWREYSNWYFRDDGAGNLLVETLLNGTNIVAGSINYATGDFTIAGNVAIPAAQARNVAAWDNLYLRDIPAGVMLVGNKLA